MTLQKVSRQPNIKQKLPNNIFFQLSPESVLGKANTLLVLFKV